MTRAMIWMWALTLLLGCTGVIGDAAGHAPGGPGGPGGAVDPRVDPSVCATAAPSVGDSPLRRLTSAQLGTTATAALGLDVLPEDVTRRLAEIPDGRAGGFASTTDAPTPEVMRRYLEIGEALAVAYMANRATGACDVSQVACVQGELDVLGTRLFRRPLESDTTRDELEDYVGIWQALKTDVGAEAAFETAVAAMVASPSFLYHAEPVVASEAVRRLR